MTHFLVHDHTDCVGVVVVEGIAAGEELTGWVMDTDATLTLTVLDAIPIGHKLALREIATGEGVIKYGADIGVAVEDIALGGHVHAHNLKTHRW